MEELILFFIHIICYWTMVFLYDKNVSDNSLAISSSLKNQLLYTLPTTIIFSNMYPMNYENIISSFMYFPVLIVSSDCYFYITHRPLHSNLLYKYHKHHHSGEVCVAKSLDANGLEHVIGNLGSFFIGILLLWYAGVILNIYVIGTWVGVATVNTCISHSNFQCSLDTGSHFLHHKHRRCNYGFGMYLMDRVMGTYK